MPTTPEDNEHFVLMLNVKRINRVPTGLVKPDRRIQDMLSFTVTEDNIADAIQKAMLLLEVERDTRGITTKSRGIDPKA